MLSLFNATAATAAATAATTTETTATIAIGISALPAFNSARGEAAKVEGEKRGSVEERERKRLSGSASE